MLNIILFSIPVLSIIARRLYKIWNNKKQIKRIKSTKEKTEEYFQKNLIEFKKIINTNKNNENIEPLFYNKNNFDNKMIEDNNETEKKWRQRILYEATPLGNIIMYYDAYKMGFSYYSDITIPYNILNAVALKYVKIYKCVDFFMDEKIMEEDDNLREYKSPIIKLYHSIENPKTKQQTVKISKEEQNILNQHKKQVFMKKKFIQNISKKPIQNISKEEIEKQILIEKEKKYISNHFYNLGKTSNFNILKVSPKIEKTEKTIKKISYKDYKQYKFTDNPVFNVCDKDQQICFFSPDKTFFSI